MFCKNCGAQIADDSEVCENCGKNLFDAPAAPAPVYQVKRDPVTPEPVPLQPPVAVETGKKKGSLKPLVILGVLGAVILAVLLIILLPSGGSKASGLPEPLLISASIADDGTAYIPMTDGTCITINDDVQDAGITADRRHVVVHLTDGTLYVTDPLLEDKHRIADDCETLASLRNDGFFYQNEDEEIFRVLFEDFATLKLGDDVAVTVAPNNTSVLFADSDGDIYTMAASSTDRVRVGTFKESVELECVSDDAQISVWVLEEDGVNTPVVNDGDDRRSLEAVDVKYNYTTATLSDDQSMVVIINSDCEYMWFKKAGEDLVKVRLGSVPASTDAYTSNGNFSKQDSKEVTSLYVAVEGDSGTNIYNVTMDGDRERVLSKVDSYEISAGNIFYTNDDSALYCAALDGSTTGEEKKIASDVDCFDVTENGRYVYYIKNCEDHMATLYCYKLGEEDPVKVASDIGCYGSNYFTTMYTEFSTDGATVLYYKDMENIGETYSRQGTLMKWTYGDEDSQRIASEVLYYSPSSAYLGGELDPSSFVFEKYVSVDGDDIYTTWMYYDGEAAAKISDEVIS